MCGDPVGATERFSFESSANDMMSVIRRLQELGRKKLVMSYAYLIDLTESHDSVDWTLLKTVPARVGELQNMILVICKFHVDVQACVRLNDRV